MVLVASLTLLRAGIWAKGFPLPLRKGFPVWRPVRSVQFQAPALWLFNYSLPKKKSGANLFGVTAGRCFATIVIL